MPDTRPNSRAPASRGRYAALAAAVVAATALVIAATQWLPSRSGALEADEHAAHPAALVRELDGAASSAAEANAAAADARARTSASDVSAPVAAASATPEAPAEQPTLVGRVVDGDGRPLQAIVVVAEGTDCCIPIELDELVEQWDDFETERTSAAADGRFEFGAELDVSNGVALYVGAAGYVPIRLDRLPLGASTNEAGTVECGELQLVRGASARGRVIDRKGHAVPSAEVRLAIVAGEQTFEMDVQGQGPLVATTDADGVFTLEGLVPGPFTLLVDAPGCPTARATGVATTAAPVAIEVVVGIGARLAGSIVGRATDAGDGYGALRVEVRPGVHSDTRVEAWSEGQTDDDRTHAQRLRACLVGADGAFEVAGLLPDVPHTLIVTAQHQDGRFRRVPEVVPLTIDPATRRVDVPWRSLGNARLRVVEAETGAPIERFAIEWRAVVSRPQRVLEEEDHWSQDVEPEWQELPEDDNDETSAQHADGRVLLPRLAPLGEQMALEVELTAPGYDRHAFTTPTFASALATDLGEIRLNRRPEVRVTVQRAHDGTPVAKATVYIVRTDEEDLAWWVASGRRPLFEDVSYGVTDAAGTVRLPSLPGGRVAVGARVPRGVVERPLELELSSAGGEELVLEVALGGVLVVQVLHPNKAPAQDVWVLWRRTSLDPGNEGDASFRATNRAGTVTVADLAPGSYEVATSPLDQTDEFDWRPVMVENGGTARVLLEAAMQATLVGRLSEGRAPLAGKRIVLQLPEPGSDPNDDVSHSSGEETVVASCLSKADGTFLLGPVALGDFEVVVHDIERAMPASVLVTLRAGVNHVEVSLPVTSLEGRLVDRDQKPWVGAWVRIHDVSGSSSDYGSVPGMSESPTGEVQYSDRGSSTGYVNTDAAGHFHFRGVNEGRVLTLDAGADHMEPLPLEIPPLADGEHRDLGTLVRDVFGELSVTVATPPAGAFELKLFDAELDVELVEHRVSLESGEGGGSWSLRGGRYRVELHDPARPGEPRRAEALVQPRLQTILPLP